MHPIQTPNPFRLLRAGLLASGGVGLAIWATHLLASAAVSPALPPQLLEVTFPEISFERMVYLTHSGDGTDRLWLVLQPGQIMLFPNQQDAVPEVFLDIRDQVTDAGNEEGLLGLAFDPEFAENGYFYVDYTAPAPRRTVISRFSVDPDNPNVADVTSELVILEVEQPFANHNGGTVAFGPDGYLYVSFGDGGFAGDPDGNGQDPTTLLGTILRIDVSQASATERYVIPSDNPLVGVGGDVRKEIWAYGFRNPWRFSFDDTTGDLWVGDVGQNRFEEVDLVRPGLNYGWNTLEGRDCFPASIASCDNTGLEPPIVDYAHIEGCSVTGGYVYRGVRLPSLEGAYIYADFCAGTVWGLRYDGESVTEHDLLAGAGVPISSFGNDEQGELYILSFDTHIYRFAAPRDAVSIPTPTEPGTQATTTIPAVTPTSIAAPSATPTEAGTPGGPPWSAGIVVLLAIGIALIIFLRSRAG